MPYVNRATRQLVEPNMKALLTGIRSLPPEKQGGAFDYVVFAMLRELTRGQPYTVQRGFVGDVVWVLLEWYRRFAIPYENIKRRANGDIK